MSEDEREKGKTDRVVKELKPGMVHQAYEIQSMMNKKEEDGEILALSHAVAFMETSDERGRERFIYHLVHRYFPDGRFQPVSTEKFEKEEYMEQRRQQVS